MVKKADLPKHIVGAAFAAAARYGWRRLSLADVADEAGLTLAQLHDLYRSKSRIVAALSRQIDAEVLARVKAKAVADESARDRLFDVLMRRFDALAPYKDGLAALARDGSASPIAAARGGIRLLRSMAWMLEAAGISSAGPLGALRTEGLAAVYVGALLVWLNDDTPDMAKTMAALDRRLACAEWLAGLCRRGRVSAPSPSPSADEVKAAG